MKVPMALGRRPIAAGAENPFSPPQKRKIPQSSPPATTLDHTPSLRGRSALAPHMLFDALSFLADCHLCRHCSRSQLVSQHCSRTLRTQHAVQRPALLALVPLAQMPAGERDASSSVCRRSSAAARPQLSCSCCTERMASSPRRASGESALW